MQDDTSTVADWMLWASNPGLYYASEAAQGGADAVSAAPGAASDALGKIAEGAVHQAGEEARKTLVAAAIAVPIAIAGTWAGLRVVQMSAPLLARGVRWLEKLL